MTKKELSELTKILNASSKATNKKIEELSDNVTLLMIDKETRDRVEKKKEPAKVIQPSSHPTEIPITPSKDRIVIFTIESGRDKWQFRLKV